MGLSKVNNDVFKGFTDKERVFVNEYVASLDPSAAAKEAGYKGNVAVTAQKMLAKPKIKKAIEALLAPSLKAAEITKENVLEQLHHFLFRDCAEFFDDDGYMVCSPKNLPPHLRQCIEGWKVTREYDEEGNISTEKYDVKFVSKAVAVDLAMKYLKLVGNVDVKVEVNETNNFWNGFYERANQPVQPPIDALITRMISNEPVDPIIESNGKAH